ncbi:MAG: DUF7483 domain-containing protein [Dolichospermum sp.]
MAYTTINKPSLQFNTVTYTGNGTAIGSGGQVITGIGFKPDWVWIKARSTTHSNRVFDAVRGVQLGLITNGTNADISMTEGLNSFNADGFTYGNHDSGNELNTTYVAWNWLGANTTVSNTQGSITSTVSANTTSGFSIVSYTGTGSLATVGHGLGVAPKFIIIKNRTAVGNAWRCYQANLFASNSASFIDLQSTSGVGSSATVFNSTAPTSSVFTVNTNTEVNQSGQTFIAYCFAEVKGFSKFGSYTGNGSTDGTFVYTGFKPAMVIIKRYDGGAENWRIFDNKRIGYNPSNYLLYPSGSFTEDTTGSNIDLLSNGFKLRETSGANSANTFIYMAFAEQPLVGTNNVPATAR